MVHLTNDMETLKFLETFDYVDWDMACCYDETPLMHCMRYPSRNSNPISATTHQKSDEIARYLIEKGANINHKSKKRMNTPIALAARFGSPEIL